MSDATILDCRLTFQEPVFFASREIDRLYLTEALIGNYALVYALGWTAGPYRTSTHRPRYAEDLKPLVGRGLYVTPAHPEFPPRFRVERFNVQTETYWSAYSNATILFDRAETKRNKPRPYANNRPQQGSLKMLATGSVFRFFAFGAAREDVPSYIRLGKWLSKARLDAQGVSARLLPADTRRLTGYYNPLDLPSDGHVEVCNIANIHPVPVLQDVVYRGQVYQLPGGAIVPAGLAFRV